MRAPRALCRFCRGGLRRAVFGLGLLLLALGGCATLEAAQLYERGTQALDAGHFEVAVRDLERAAELTPGVSEIHNHLGLAYAAQGKEWKALAEFQRAVEFDCDNQAARRNLFVTEQRLGVTPQSMLEVPSGVE